MGEKSSGITTKIVWVFAIIIGILSLYLLLSVQTPKKALSGTGDNISNVAAIGGNFELIDQDSNIFNSDKLKGKLSLIYFGFTYCPDICPTSLKKIVEVLNTLDKYKIDINSVFITIDPDRDTASNLKKYLGHFSPKFIGLTGNEEQIKDVAKKFGVYYSRSASNTSNSNNYMVDHSSFVYVMDKKGSYLKHFYMNSSPEEIVEFIRINK